MEAGLYLVGTPIGNLGDLTLRATAALKEGDWIYAEDTRRTRALLSHLGIRGKKVATFHSHSRDEQLEALLARVEAGLSVVLVTDAGMPSISDPGALAVRAARARQLSVFVIPGPSAAVAAVALSGLVDGPFCFLGFLPRRGLKRQRALDRIQHSAEPVVLFEAPRRTARTLADLAAICPEREVCVCRELTKVHEEATLGTARDLAGLEREWRGEVTLVIAASSANPLQDDDQALEASILARLEAGASPRNIAEELSTTTGGSRRTLYKRALELRARSVPRET